jgi:hypothetical protein
MKIPVVLIVIAFTATLASADPRLWNPPLAIRQGTHLEWEQSTARDANGNVLMVWADARRGDLDIFAQLMNADGIPQWAEGGVCVVSAPGTQRSPVAVAVAGGWIVAWSDTRNPNTGNEYNTWIWAQKLSAGGLPLWPDNNQTGVIVDDQYTGVDFTYMTYLVHDGVGGAMVVWRRYTQTSGYDVLMQRMTAAGGRAWTSVLYVMNPQYSIGPFMADDDGNGNVLVVWNDSRSGDTKVYVSKITIEGQKPWGEDGIAVCDSCGWQAPHGICRDGSGGAFVVWSGRANDGNATFAQSVNAAGQFQWLSGGIQIYDIPVYEPRNISITPSVNDTAVDGFIMVWEDERVNGDISEIYAQKISRQGIEVWGANGLKVCGNASGDYTNPLGEHRVNAHCISDHAGGLVAVWDDYRTGPLYYCRLFAARVLADGSMPWVEDGVPVADGRLYQSRCNLHLNNGFLAVYNDYRSGSQSLCVQELNFSGQRLLSDSGLVVMTGWDYSAWNAEVVAMSGGRVAYVWVDERHYEGRQLYFQITNSDGEFEKPVGGARLVESISISGNKLSVCADGNGGFFAVYTDNSEGPSRIMAVHVNAAGQVDSNSNGNMVYVPAQTSDQYDARCVTDGHGGAYVAWGNYNWDYYQNLYVMRINSACSPVWTYAVQLTAIEDNGELFGLAAAADGSCVAGWYSGPWGTYAVNAARILSQGYVVYNRLICDAQDVRNDAALVVEAEGGAYLAWSVHRGAGAEEDIFAQRLSPMGVDLWAHNGIEVNGDTLVQSQPRLALESNGNLFVLWSDLRSNVEGAVYGQKISPEGTRLWADHGVPIVTTSFSQFTLKIVSDGADGLFAVWDELRTFHGTEQKLVVVGTHLQGNGSPVADPFWIPNQGSLLFDSTGLGQRNPVVVVDDAGHFVVAANRYYSSGDETYYEDLYAQRIRNITSAAESHPAVTYQFELEQNYPNPFNPATTISFSLPQSGQTRLTIYNLLGEEVARLTDRVMPAGQYRLSFDGKALSSGIYFYRLESPAGTLTKRMLLLK